MYYHQHEVDHVILHDAMDTAAAAAADNGENAERTWRHLALQQQGV